MATNHYVTNKVLYEEIVKCKDASIVTAEILDMFTLMSKKISLKHKFWVEEDRQDVVMGGIEDAWRYFDRFDPSKGTNAFAYVTSIIYNGQQKAWRSIYNYYKKADQPVIHVTLNNNFSL